jgi:hypothetical protein
MYSSASIAEAKGFPIPSSQFCGIDAWGPENFENSGSGSLSFYIDVSTLKNPRWEG